LNRHFCLRLLWLSAPMLLCSGAEALIAERDTRERRDTRDEPHPPYLDAKSQRNGETNLKAPPPSGGRLDGLYATQEGGGDMGPGGVFYPSVNWRFYYFLPNGYVYLGAKEAGLESLSCNRVTVDKYGDPMCTTYSVENDQLRIGLRTPTRQRRKGDELRIGDYAFSRIPKLNDTRLSGEYSYFSAGVAAANSSSISFRRDGKFQSSNFVGVSVDTDPSNSGKTGSARVTVSGSGASSAEGSYRIQGHTLELNYSDGRKARAFFVPVAGDSVLRIGSRVYAKK
jgi:hypothetical protein